MEFEPALYENLEPTPEHLEPVLQELGILHPGDSSLAEEEEMRAALEFGRSLAGINPAAGAAILAVVAAVAVEEGFTNQIWGPALKAAAATRTPTAVWFLRELTHWPGGGPIEREAQTYFVDLHLSEIQPEPPTRERLHTGMLSGVDTDGSRRIALFFRSEDNRVRGLSLALQDETGVQQVTFKGDDASSTELQLEHAALMWAKCDLVLAREVLGDAFALHRERKVPPPGALLLYRHLFGPNPIDIRPRKPNLDAFRLERVRPHPDMVEGSDSMVSYPAFARLTFSSDEAYRCVRDRLMGDRSRSGAHAVSRTFLRDLARAVEPAERHVLLRRLGANLEVEALMGDAKKPMNRLAALTWFAILREVVPFHEIPYVQALCDRSISAIAKTLGDRFAPDELTLDAFDDDDLDRLAMDAIEEYETQQSGRISLKELSEEDFEEHETDPGLDEEHETDPGLD